MIVDLTGAIALWLGRELGISVWDGETPRTDSGGQPIKPNSGVPNSWPVVKVWMQTPFKREWTFEDPWSEQGTVKVNVWATSKTQCKNLASQIEELLASIANWASIDLGGPDENKNYAIQVLLDDWWLEQEKDVRTDTSQLLFRCDMNYNCMVHGATPTS